MENREKYAGEIKDYIGEDFCGDFIRPIILKREHCGDIGCAQCFLLQMLWLEEKYKEPEVDWTKVAVDTPILVRDIECDVWHKANFAKFEKGRVYVWLSGKTSWTAENKNEITSWIYAKLAEQEKSDGK